MTIEQLTYDAIALLTKLIEIPRVSREEEQASDLLQQCMEDWGLGPKREGNNLWSIAPNYKEDHPTLLLCAHIDTVKAVDGWTHNPNQATTEGDILYGLGSNDDGASLVSLLQVFRVLRTQTRPYNLIFLSTAEEEVGGHNGIERILPLLPHIDVALVGEPTGMQPAIAEKGLMVLDVTAHGRAGHAARNEGENAIYKAIKDIEWFRNTNFPNQSELLGPTKMTVTIIDAGTQHNVIPDKCHFVVDVRTNEFYSNEEIYNEIRKHVDSEVIARSFRLNSSRIDIKHPLVQRAIELGRNPYGSPTLSDQALLRCPSLKMGPGESSRSHTADEFIKISEISHAIDLYLKLLDGLTW
ncbi:MAG: M20 family metallo-hydrolase [Bacteroidaceae bacterium]|nr:M20 family metallo-hydrolase [Bacteroidaceae bacterium]